ncbi:MAG TPA: hypothetical protein VK034_19475 [Enhygromyxa sp.]|nr:hypothetical protein [Enhygromyxa sp.]
MRSRRIAALFLPALALALSIPAVAYAADQTGSEGRAKIIEVNAPSSDSYLQFHGRLYVTSGKTTTEYRWGGTSCGSRTMTPEMVDLLVDIVRSNGDVRIVPNYQNGQGSTKCLVGFKIKDKEDGGGNGNNGKGGKGKGKGDPQ